jgi:predicted MPP superfamily phosphohydrolase
VKAVGPVVRKRHDEVRGRRLRRALVLLFALGLLAASWAVLLEPRRLVVRETELQLPRWPKQLAGLKVALLADLHIGSPHWDVAALGKLVERTNELQPDLVLLAGDYQINEIIGGTFVEAEPIADGLGRLKARLGVVAVLGNHDWWNDGERTRRAFQAKGITVLEESSVRLEHNGVSFYVVGLADQMERKSDAKAAVQSVPAGAPHLLLVHEPDVFESFARLQVSPNLTLAGHTHGGQVWLPLLGRRVVPSEFGERYAYGHVVENGLDLFVTSGVGTSILPVRFLVPPEIALLTLR